MDTSIKRLLEVAGVDITKGKAKQLCEAKQSSLRDVLFELGNDYVSDWVASFGEDDYPSDDKLGKYITKWEKQIAANPPSNVKTLMKNDNVATAELKTILNSVGDDLFQRFDEARYG